jgi:hypothetical protein
MAADQQRTPLEPTDGGPTEQTDLGGVIPPEPPPLSNIDYQPTNPKIIDGVDLTKPIQQAQDAQNSQVADQAAQQETVPTAGSSDPNQPTQKSLSDFAQTIPSYSYNAVKGPNNSYDKSLLPSAFTAQIGNNQTYYIETFIFNDLNGWNPVPIPFQSIETLSIEENLLDWVTKGYIDLKNNYEFWERGAFGTSFGTNVNPSYLFRTDGRNRISFRIIPVANTVNGQKDFDPKYWEMSYDFVIYDVEDIFTDYNSSKIKRYYFWDERYQILTERNIEYSSAYTNAGTNSGLATINSAAQGNHSSLLEPISPQTNLTDEQRAANPNAILKDIITTAGSNPPTMANTSTPLGQAGVGGNINVGFKKDGSISNPTEPFAKIDTENWDTGNPKNLLFYTSPAHFQAVHDLKYVMTHAVSLYNNTPVILKFGRNSDDKTWKLYSLAKLFQNSQKDQIERIIIEDSVEINQNGPYYPRASVYATSDVVNFNSPFTSRIQFYNYSQMTALDDIKITNSPGYNYDFSTGTYFGHFAQNTAQIVKDTLTYLGKNALWNLSSNIPNGGGAIKLNLNQTKITGINTKPHLITKKIFDGAPANMAANLMIKDALFLNDAISFVANGLTLRTPGKFIHIDRLASSAMTNAFDDRFLGQWLLVKVNHIFSQSSYKNEVAAVKADSFSKIFPYKENKM